MFIYLISYIVASMKKETNIQLTGFEMLEKKVNKSGNSGRVYVPIEWVGKKVKIILVEK
jgi:putative transposon-encoded protein